jgi:hypothetical protein
LEKVETKEFNKGSQENGYGCLGVMVFNATFNNIIYIILWRSVLLASETGVPGETTDQLQITDKLLYIVHHAITIMTTPSMHVGD